MKPQDRKTYSSRFTALTDAESVTRARKNYLIWIKTGSVLFFIVAAYFYYKVFLASAQISDQTSASTTETSAATDSLPKQSKYKLYNPKPLLARFKFKTQTEFPCEESQPRFQAIPSVFIEQIFGNDFQNIHDYISLDLLIHYDNIINEFRPNYLKSVFNEYQSKWLLVRNSGDFVKFLANLNSNKFKFYAEYLKRRRVELDIKRFQNYFALTEELSVWYSYLERLASFLLGYEQQKFGKYFENCTDRSFQKYVEETQKLVLRFVYPFNITERKLKEINKVIQESATPLKIEFYNSSISFHNRVILLSEVNEHLSKLDKSLLKSVYIFASHAVYLDEDVELFGVNLVIISPKWEFLKKVNINLNGLLGKDITEAASPSEAGRPGNPGGNAGDFLGVGNLQEEFLIISANGGKGGKGQNGANGRNGIDNSFPAPPVDKPSSCIIKINSFNDTFRRKVTHYQIYSEKGCGGPGTDGGVGGAGGEGGVVSLIANEGVKVRRGFRGNVGLPGRGGTGGVGGRDGCFYEALDVDDEILHRVTRVKCPLRNVLPHGELGKDNSNTRGQIFPPVKENLKVGNSLSQFFRVAVGDFIKYNDYDVVTFLKKLNQWDVVQYEDVTDLISEYKSIKNKNAIEFFHIFKEKVTLHMQQSSDKSTEVLLKYLKSMTLGEIMILKENLNYFFIDMKSYLKLLKNNIRNTNASTRDFRSISYLQQKVETKLELIEESLKSIKTTALALGDSSRDTISEDMARRKFLCIVITTVDIFYTIVNGSSRALRSVEPVGLPELCSGNIEKGSNFSVSLSEEERDLFRVLENLANNNKQEIRAQMVELKMALWAMTATEELSQAGRNLLQALTDELERFIALYNFIEWEEIGNLFLKSLSNLTESLHSTENEENKFLESRLVDVMIGIQYKLAMDASRESVNHFMNLQTRLPPFLENAAADDVSTQITLLQDVIDQDVDSFCKNQLKAVFDKDSSVGEFYYWSSEDIQNESQNLFSGAEINLTSSLINRHVFDKNYVQFTSIKLEFECFRNGIVCERQIREILSDFKVGITHSGYSYYNWKGKTHVVVSEKVNLEYSFRTRDNGKPEVYNALFKKCQDGEIKLSPFTTWSVRLLPINNNADFNKLSTFAGAVNFRLTGTGTYIA